MTNSVRRRTLADAHIHLFDGGFAGPLGRSPAGGDEVATYEALRGTHDIGCALVVAYEGQERYRGNNDHVAALAREREWIAPVAYLPTWPPPDGATLDRLLTQGFVGVAFWVLDPTRAEQLASWPATATTAVGRFRVVSLNARSEHTATISGFVNDVAPATVLFSHLGMPGRQRRQPSAAAARERLAPLLALAALDHVAVKASGYYSVHEPPHEHPHRAAWPFVEVLVEAFGADRICWGSDYSPALAQVSFGQALDVWLPPALTDRDVGAVMGGNLLRILDRGR